MTRLPSRRGCALALIARSTRQDDVYWTLRATLVTRREELEDLAEVLAGIERRHAT